MDLEDVEIWAPVAGFETSYAVSSSGNVRSLSRTRKGCGGFPVEVKEKILAASDRNGYVGVSLGRGKSSSIHRLVAIAFIPNQLNRPEVNHIDGDKKNNRAINLEWVTHKENASHASKTGLLAVGIRHGRHTKPEAFK